MFAGVSVVNQYNVVPAKPPKTKYLPLETYLPVWRKISAATYRLLASPGTWKEVSAPASRSYRV